MTRTGRSWVLKIANGVGPDGKPRRQEFGLGSCADVSLACARLAAVKLRQSIRNGIQLPAKGSDCTYVNMLTMPMVTKIKAGDEYKLSVNESVSFASVFRTVNGFRSRRRWLEKLSPPCLLVFASVGRAKSNSGHGTDSGV